MFSHTNCTLLIRPASLTWYTAITFAAPPSGRPVITSRSTTTLPLLSLPVTSACTSDSVKRFTYRGRISAWPVASTLPVWRSTRVQSSEKRVMKASMSRVLYTSSWRCTTDIGSLDRPDASLDIDMLGRAAAEPPRRPAGNLLRLSMPRALEGASAWMRERSRALAGAEAKAEQPRRWMAQMDSSPRVALIHPQRMRSLPVCVSLGGDTRRFSNTPRSRAMRASPAGRLRLFLRR
mmetsp:Transcript_26659/g.52001  ORF Transcript_26659/g.52001 Transcript_26659/m.52001 type:complete len:235 (+) Transcript_26659:70-774(+)